MRRSTTGRSLDANLAVYRGNVALGGQVATALAASARS
jgi:pseudouridine-5'-phosphate glycosidase